MKLIQRKLNSQEAKELIAHLQEQDKILNQPMRDYQYIDGNVGDWRILPNGATVFYCPAYYGYAEEL